MSYDYDSYLKNHCIVQMPIKKLKNMPMVTLKNMDNIMGKIDRFLRKHQIQRYNGYNQIQTGARLVNVDGYKFVEKIFSDEYYPSYSVYIGRCKHHVLFENPDNYCKFYRKKRNEIGSVALSISTKYSDSCIPIYFGDRVKIFGDRLVIYSAFNKYTNHTPWIRYTELRMVPYTKNEKFKYKLQGSMVANLSDFIYDDVSDYAACDELYKIVDMEVHNFCDIAVNAMNDKIDAGIDITQHVIKTLACDEDYGTLTMTLDIDKAIDETDLKSEYLTYEFTSSISDDKFESHNLNDIKRDIIRMVYKVNEYDEYGEDNDYDFEDFSNLEDLLDDYDDGE